MSLFQCRSCGCVENTACCNYWSNKSDGKPIVCSECDPEIGQWHGNFSKRSAAGMLVDDQGYLWSHTSAASLAPHFKIMGEVFALSAESK